MGAVVLSLQENTHFFLEMEMTIRFIVHKKIIQAVKWAQFVSDGMSYIIIRGPWYHIIVLNVHAPTEAKLFVCYIYVTNLNFVGPF
jgi:hypothetical protein